MRYHNTLYAIGAAALLYVASHLPGCTPTETIEKKVETPAAEKKEDPADKVSKPEYSQEFLDDIKRILEKESRPIEDSVSDNVIGGR